MFLLKWLITGIIIYFLYKRFFALPPPKGPDNNQNINRSQPDDEGDYIDYEEVD